MIDKYLTSFQATIVGGAREFFYERRKSVSYLGAHIVMPLTIGLAGSIDYLKLPLSVIEEFAKGLLTGMFAPFNEDLSRWSFGHFKNSREYVHKCIDKVMVGWVEDLSCMLDAFKSPLIIPEFSPASYCGKNMIYFKISRIYSEDHPLLNHPSIHPDSQ